MKILLMAFLAIPLICHSQDSSFTVSRVLHFDSLSKDQIYDKAILWCGQRFMDSHSAIKVSSKESGLLSGKAYFLNIYYVPRKKDSTVSIVYNNYYFNWSIEIKDKKLRFKIFEVELETAGSRYPVGVNDKAPPVMAEFASRSAFDEPYRLSKLSFVKNMNILADQLSESVAKKSEEW